MHLEKVGNKYLKIDGVQIKMKEPYKYAEAYIEEGFYQTAKMEQKGIQYDLLGIFNMRFFKDDTGKDPSPLLVFNFPTRIMTQPTAQEKRTMVLNPAEGEKTYIILKYYSEDLIIINRNIVSKFVNTEQFFKIFTGGKFPTCVPYDAVLPMMLDNMAINKQKNLDSSPLIFSFIVGESIRAKKDKSKVTTVKSDDLDAITFRLALKPGINNDKYRPETLDVSLVKNNEFQFKTFFIEVFKKTAVDSMEKDYKKLVANKKQVKAALNEAEEKLKINEFDKSANQSKTKAESQLEEIDMKISQVTDTLQKYQDLEYDDEMFANLNTKARVFDIDEFKKQQNKR